MASTTWVSELPSSAAARCADARSVWSILIVRCGRRPAALATRRCGNGGGGSQFTTNSRSSAGARRRTRACTACRLMPRASASGRSGQPASFSAASVADSSSLRPEERSSRSRAAIRSGSTGRRGTGERRAPPCAGGFGGSSPRASAACTYWRSPCVTTSDIVRPSRARRAFLAHQCSSGLSHGLQTSANTGPSCPWPERAVLAALIKRIEVKVDQIDLHLRPLRLCAKRWQAFTA